VKPLGAARLQERRTRNDNWNNLALNVPRIIGPRSPVGDALEDIHEGLFEIPARMERLNERQKEIVADANERRYRLNDVLSRGGAQSAAE
jgi:hypothetical protein